MKGKPEESFAERITVHPLLFALYPVLFLFAFNIEHTSATEIFLPATLSVLGAALIWLLAWPLLGDQRKSGVLATIFFFLFFSYGHIYKVIEGLKTGRPETQIHLFLVITWAVLLVLGAFFVWRAKGDLGRLTAFLNTMGAVLVVISLANIVYYSVGLSGRELDKPNESVRKVSSDTGKTYPDIYYIVLDGYARQDTLTELYDYDNSDFLNYLEKKGFYVASKSMSNYNQTSLSIASSLNYNYIQNLLPNADPNSNDKTPLEQSEIRKNPAIAKLLKEYGYEFITFSTGYSGTELRQADRYVKAPGSLTEFQNVLLNTTVVSAVLGPLVKSVPFQFEARRKELNWLFDRVPDFTRSDGNVFVYAHILAPHPPFVFGPNGEARNPNTVFSIGDGSHYFGVPGNTKEAYIRGYRDQLAYLNEKTKTMIERILSESKRPPVIIVQSDHGPGSEMNHESPADTNLKERMSNLNTFYFPDGDYDLLYDTITPVNNFRVVLSKYFQETELLEDKSYAAPWSRPYLYHEVIQKEN